MIFEILRHVRFGHFGEVVVGHRLPAVDPVQLEQEAGLAVVVAVVFFADAFDVAALWEFQVNTKLPHCNILKHLTQRYSTHRAYIAT